MMTKAERATARARCKAATGGTWEPEVWTDFDAGLNAAVGPRHPLREDEDDICPDCCEGGLQARLDAEFITHARQDLPASLDTIERLGYVIRSLEWSGRSTKHLSDGRSRRVRSCPSCGGLQEVGHNQHCQLGAALAALED